MKNIAVPSYYVNQKPRGSDTEEETKPLKAEETGAGATSTSTEGEKNTIDHGPYNTIKCSAMNVS